MGTREPTTYTSWSSPNTGSGLGSTKCSVPPLTSHTLGVVEPAASPKVAQVVGMVNDDSSLSSFFSPSLTLR